MELRHLRYFSAVADTLHFGRAARRVHISQPTLSQQIRQLEEEVGTPLFERTRAGVRLTQAGELFRTYASRALEDVNAGLSAVGALRGLATGALRVGYPPSMRGIVVPALAAVLRKHPGLALSAEEAVVRRLERRLADGRLDVGLGYAPARLADLDAEPVFDSRLVLVVARGHALAGAESVGVKLLAEEPFALLSRGLRVRARVDAHFAAIRLVPRVALESNAVATVLAIVRAGLAVTVLPEPRLADAERLVVKRLSPAPRSELAALLWRKGAPRTPAAELFAAEVRARAKEDAG
ncbi:LysR substrate-binding domain-containing protein [Corallococcus llansteffanensis]|uniref:LysR family transcriptional regulator n=1 Tax=Corallococcus llansteffanensis TaxID=2316731 RepID=A0A3A8PNY6_9BACT|nr:LysR substrate-binding domain-containing protein [Corallococcus llansteffanensis]RKH58043.1 LysR family transcriptional regulator [Corallococcus llansteffanensis]